VTIDLVDEREDYGEERIVSFGLLDARVVVVVWTERGDERPLNTLAASSKSRPRSLSVLARFVGSQTIFTTLCIHKKCLCKHGCDRPPRPNGQRDGDKLDVVSVVETEDAAMLRAWVFVRHTKNKHGRLHDVPGSGNMATGRRVDGTRASAEQMANRSSYEEL